MDRNTPRNHERTCEAQARALKVTRAQHARENTQDYLEAIADLIRTTGEARIVDLAGRLGLSHATVIQTIRRLQRDGFVTTEPYRSIYLTDDGRTVARNARHRHTVTVGVLEKLGVDSETALADAEGMEHHLSPQTLRAFEKFLGLVPKKSH